MAMMTSEFAAAISPQLARTEADTLVAELLPLLEACLFLEREARRILQVRRLGRKGLPLWLSGLKSEVVRGPLGTVLVIGPSNYPLFLPGVQALQALAAGNAVIWKPGRGGRAVAELFAEAMYAAGLPRDLLRCTDESVEAVERELAAGVDKVFFTGSATAGQMLLKRLAQQLIPCVAELSGCDAVVVLPSANLERVVAALGFGMRLNGSATCMAPRRVLLVDATPRRRAELVAMLESALREIEPIAVTPAVQQQVRELLDEAMDAGATVVGGAAAMMHPILVTDASPSMQLAQTDVFAPVLAVIDVSGEKGVLEAQSACPFGLTASIFGDETDGRRMAAKLDVGSVLINDVIVPTADPRVPFGGRRKSGFGTTRGLEGLLEMTAAKTISVRRGSSTRHFEAAGVAHRGLFEALIQTSHAGSLGQRWSGVRKLVAAAKRMKAK